MIRNLVVLAPFFAAATPALALSTATTTLSDFRITLTDLAPADGVTPTLVLDPAAVSVADAGEAEPGLNEITTVRGSSPFGAVSASGEVAGTGGSSSLSGDPSGDGALFTAHGYGVPQWATGVGGFYIEGLSSAEPALVLPAHSEVTFTGLAQVDWDASAAAGYADGVIRFGFIDVSSGTSSVLAADELDAGYSQFYGGDVQGSSSRQLTVSWRNDSDTDLTLGYFVALQVSASAENVLPTSVPEPAPAALLLAGLGAYLSRRCRSNGARRFEGAADPAPPVGSRLAPSGGRER